ncbi:MAG TPA: DUF1002 domain-containing protein [Alloiococcus sp.]|nr:DUF1002 domain-containing protein [Alloiococcus sp.]
MLKKITKMIATGAAALLVGVGGLQTVTAEGTIDTSVIDEAWGKPTYVYGGGLSEQQIDETADLLDIDSRENVAEIAALGEDLQTYLNSGVGSTSSMISSVLVQRSGDHSGVNVNIVTPENITRITEEQYMNAAITAGVEDANIMVAAIRPVTGESALTGVYKAFDVNGEELETDRMEVAQEELETTNQISQDLSEDDSARLNQAIAEIKRDLAELKDQVDGLATREDIERIINEALERHNLENVITQDQIDRLISLFEHYQQTSAIDSEKVLEQLNNFSNDLQDRFGDVIQKAEDSGLIDTIVNFFRELWHTIISLFN